MAHPRNVGSPEYSLRPERVEHLAQIAVQDGERIRLAGKVRDRTRLYGNVRRLANASSPGKWAKASWSAFAAAFGSADITRRNIELALATFERSIVGEQTPFDRWVEGDETAIGQSAKRGFDIFNGKARCSGCHNGFAFSDGSFHDIGAAKVADIGRGRLFPSSVKLRYKWGGSPIGMVTMRRTEHVIAGQHDADGQRVRWGTEKPPRRVGNAEYVAGRTLGFIRNVGPRSVNLMPRDVRRNRGKPISSSKRRTCSPTADCEMLSRVTALVKLRSLATEAHIEFREIPRTAPSHFQISHIARLRRANRVTAC